MRKIPTLFQREFRDHRVVELVDRVAPGLEWVLNGEGTATVKWDGACCAIIDGKFYKRYDAKRGKKPPEGAIPCTEEPDPVTGHWPHWVPVSSENPADIWFIEAVCRSAGSGTIDEFVRLPDWTYEAVGPHFQNNPYNLALDYLVPHGKDTIEVADRSINGLRKVLWKQNIEGIVFWKDGEPKCKIKQTDYGFVWPGHTNTGMGVRLPIVLENGKRAVPKYD